MIDLYVYPLAVIPIYLVCGFLTLILFVSDEEMDIYLHQRLLVFVIWPLFFIVLLGFIVIESTKWLLNDFIDAIVEKINK